MPYRVIVDTTGAGIGTSPDDVWVQLPHRAEAEEYARILRETLPHTYPAIIVRVEEESAPLDHNLDHTQTTEPHDDR